MAYGTQGLLKVAQRALNGPVHSLQQRELGLECKKWASEYAFTRYSRLALSGTKIYKPVHHGNINALDLDNSERRYLLAGAGDTSVAVYDTQAIAADSEDGDIAPLFVFNKSNPCSHQYMISSVAWYPVDTGLFVTGAYDNAVKVWDTNTLEVIANFSLPAKVSKISFSYIATAHCLVGVASHDQHVRLCDPVTGAFTHTLTGHREAVWSVAWSNVNEYQLLSGDAVGQVRLWDIRRAGCLALLDQFTTQRLAPVKEQEQQQQQQQGRSRIADPRAAKKAKTDLRSPLPGREAIDGPGSRQQAATAKAHNGAVTCILPTPDGLSLLTAGVDDRLRLWDSHYLFNRLVNYSKAHNRTTRARQCAVSDDARVVFYPSGSGVNVYDTQQGLLLHTLANGHFEPVNCCTYNSNLEEAYTGASDNRILVWQAAASDDERGEEDEEGEESGDRWGDD